MMHDEMIKDINNNYNIGEIVLITNPPNGSGNAFLVESTSGKYIYKINERNDFVSIYYSVTQILSQIKLVNSHIIKTNMNELMTLDHSVLYTFLDGDSLHDLTKIQIENAIIYLKTYNTGLKVIPFCSDYLHEKNWWDRARSLSFITEELINIIPDKQSEIKNIIMPAIQILSDNAEKLSSLPLQLIHSDLGGDNFLFTGNDVLSIIDFTPDYNHELYSLCQFAYWNYLWNSDFADSNVLDNYVKIYYGTDPSINTKKTFYLLLVQASIFRVAGVLLNMINCDKINMDILRKRLRIVRDVVMLCNLVK